MPTPKKMGRPRSTVPPESPLGEEGGFIAVVGKRGRGRPIKYDRPMTGKEKARRAYARRTRGIDLHPEDELPSFDDDRARRGRLAAGSKARGKLQPKPKPKARPAAPQSKFSLT